MVLLIVKRLILFQFFLSKDTKKLIAIKVFCLSSSGDMLTLPTATPMQRTFFNWNFTWLRISVTLVSKASECWTIVGNLPALFKPGPSNLGICGTSTWEAKKASKDWANFFTSFLFLLSFFKSSTLLNGMPARW